MNIGKSEKSGREQQPVSHCDSGWFCFSPFTSLSHLQILKSCFTVKLQKLLEHNISKTQIDSLSPKYSKYYFFFYFLNSTYIEHKLQWTAITLMLHSSLDFLFPSRVHCMMILISSEILKKKLWCCQNRWLL